MNTTKAFVIIILNVVLMQIMFAQSANVQVSGVHDSNIFDTDSATSDQSAQVLVGASKDWDANQLSLSLSYEGALQYFIQFPLRTFQIHKALFSSTYQFYKDDEEEIDSTDVEQDSTDIEEDSVATEVDSIAKSAATLTENTVVHDDSLDQFLYSSLFAASQSNHEEFSQFDNFVLKGSGVFRQPLGKRWNMLPSYTFTYHHYPNLTGFTNFEHLIGLEFTTSAFEHSHVAANVALGIKNYPIALADTVTFTLRNGKKRSVITSSAIPSVNQVVFSVNWEQKLNSASKVFCTLTHYGIPNQQARVYTVKGKKNTISVTGKQNEIYDDHFGFSGNNLQVQLTQKLPLGVGMTVTMSAQKKKYTVEISQFDPDAADTVSKRSDVQFENELSVSKTFSLNSGSTLKPQLEITYIRNESNAPLFDFSKYSVMFGIEYGF